MTETPTPHPPPAGSLINRVTRAIFRSGPLLQVPIEAQSQACAAIREVAAWLRKNDSEYQMGGDAAATADLLDEEVTEFTSPPYTP